MAKKQAHITISEENKAWLDENIRNKSALIDHVIELLRKSDDDLQEAAKGARMRVLKIQQEVLRKEITELQRIEEQIDTVLNPTEQREASPWKFDLAEMDYTDTPGPLKWRTDEEE